MASWKERATVVAPETSTKTGSWKDRAVSIPEEVSELESGARGTLQGVTAGFSDEISGGIEALWEKAKGDPSTFGELYKAKRDESREANKAAEKANPASYTTGNVAGAVGSAFIPGLGGATLGKLALQGAATGLGASEADLTEGDVTGAAKDTAIGAGVGIAAGLAGKLIGAGVNKAAPYVKQAASSVGSSLQSGAEKLAIKATGATGNQASKFAPSAGRELLDQGLIKPLDSAASIAERIGTRHSQAGAAIGDALETLEKRGVTGSVDNIVSVLEAQVDDLSKVPGNEKIVKQLQGEIDNLYNRGQSNLGIKSTEQAKRNFQGQTNYFSDEAEKKATGRLASSFKDEVERSALAADPSLAQTFIDEKKMFGLLSPVKEAAEKRAMQQAQSPFGGALDVVSGIAAGPQGLIAKTAIEQVGRRSASTAAVGLDKIGSLLKSNPQAFGRFGKALQKAAERSPHSLAVAHYLLQQKDEEYRNTIKGLEEN